MKKTSSVHTEPDTRTRHQNQTEQQEQQQHVGVRVSAEEIRTTSLDGDVTENL